MDTIDKNDVEISKLFTWKKKFDLKDTVGNKYGSVYIRLAGDADINRARVFALRESANLRKKLNDPNSDENLAFLPNFDDIEREYLETLTVSLLIRDIARDAVDNVHVPLPIEPRSDADLESHEEYQKLVDEYPEKRSQAVNTYIEQRVKEEQGKIQGMSDEVLHKTFLRLTTNTLCENLMINKFKEFCVYQNTFRDSKLTKKLFSTYEEFDNTQTFIKEQLLAYYNELEVDMQTLKKLPEAML